MREESRYLQRPKLNEKETMYVDIRLKEKYLYDASKCSASPPPIIYLLREAQSTINKRISVMKAAAAKPISNPTYVRAT